MSNPEIRILGGDIMKKVLAVILIFLFVLVGCKSTSFINTKDNIVNYGELEY